MDPWNEAIAWIKGLQKFGIKPGLERMNWMLESLGHPQNRLKFIHIAGTNGKGSTAAYIGSVLQEAGFVVGSFTSPGIDLFLDRIRLNGEDIPESVLVQLIERIRPLTEELEQMEWGSLTEFEATTILAILYFGTVAYPDFVVWETGLGGRLDSTNVVIPIITAITNIGHDHMDILGETLEEIALEKAGIIKPGVPIVTTEEKQSSREILSQVAKDKKASFYYLGKQFVVLRNTYSESFLSGEQFAFEGPFASYHELKVPLLGEHQMKNAALAVMVLEVLRQYYAVFYEEKDLRRGLENVTWPGRFEIVQKNPYLILDGAHNIEGAESLVRTFVDCFPGKKAKLLFSALRDKNIEGMVHKLMSISDHVIISETDHPRAAKVEDLEMWFRDAAPDLPIMTVSDWHEAVDLWYRGQRREDDILLAAGSLYFITDLRRELMKSKVHHSCCNLHEKAGELN
jgi:dihydrofolate synthase/folylpolyglutamate synthase